LGFTMADSVQGWKKKWFYIKDQKKLFFWLVRHCPFWCQPRSEEVIDTSQTYL
jgi:hypothetical protein